MLTSLPLLASHQIDFFKNFILSFVRMFAESSKFLLELRNFATTLLTLLPKLHRTKNDVTRLMTSVFLFQIFCNCFGNFEIAQYTNLWSIVVE